MGRDVFLKEVEKEYGAPLRRASDIELASRPKADKHGHIGVHPQKQPGLNYLGVVLPVGRITSEQMRGLAEISERCGSGTLRLTVWQNLLISDVADKDVGVCIAALQALGIGVEASAIRRGLVACTGNAGCKFSASNTKGHALRLAGHLEARLAVDLPINIHLTGCHHSCAQHYVGDIGLLACKVERGEDSVEGYHVYIGGGAASTAEQAMAREYAQSVPFDDLPAMLERLLATWLAHRKAPTESFFEFCRRHEIAALRELASLTPLRALAA
jgi:ferredoxin-nitrite reductase